MTRPTPLTDPPFLTGFPFNLGVRLFGPGSLDRIRPTDEQRAAYRKFTQMGDPLADALVARFREMPAGEGRRMFDAALERGIEHVSEAPEELRALFAQVDAVPYWVDREKLDHAARVTCRTGVWALNLALPALALNGGYLAQRADKTLIGTGDLARMAPRRISETAQWWIDVTTPGALGRFEIGFKSILRVRLMHALVRAGMSRRPDWDYEAWDYPVNQSLAAGTLMLFSMVNLIGCQAIGMHFSAQEKTSVYHLWRYVGHLLGLDPEIVPTNEDDTWRLLWLQADYELKPDQDSVELSQALFAAAPVVFGIAGDRLHHRMLAYLLVGYTGSYSRIMIGKANADYLGTPYSAPLMAAVVATAAVNAALEVPRRIVPGATRLSEAAGDRSRRWLVRRSIHQTRGERTYGRHDGLAVPAA